MTSMSNLDQLVKGTAAPETQLDKFPSTSGSIGSSQSQDPFASLPSSPPQVYLNLLILEASLRAQWLQLRSRKRQHTFFLTLLALWIMYFGYALFLAPREDGNGVGGSVYWVVEAAEKLCLLGGLVTGILVWGTGQWERGVRWPRRWVYNTNRGLRVFNCKIVVIKQSWWSELLSMLSFLFSYSLFSGNNGSSFRYVDLTILRESENIPVTNIRDAFTARKDEEYLGYEEDLSPGGDYIKLLLLPKPFSPGFRENWDVYRTEHWEKENERRLMLRKKIQERDKKAAKQRRGLWWASYLSWKKTKNQENEKAHHAVHRHGERERHRIHGGIIKSASHPQNLSQGKTYLTEIEDRSLGGNLRHGNTASNASGKRRKGTLTKGCVSKSTSARPRSIPPENPSRLVKQSSRTSISSSNE